MDLNQHLVSCPKCKKSINGHTLIHAAQDDLSVFGLLNDVRKIILDKRPTLRPRRLVGNHLFDTSTCFVCGQ